jgi:hypothetical protein
MGLRRRIVASGNKRMRSIKEKMSMFDFGSAVSNIVSTVTQSLTNPTVICTIAFVAFTVVTCGPTYTTGYIGEFTKGMNNTFVNWMHKYPNDFSGLLIFSPAVVAAPSQYRVVYCFITWVWIALLPQFMYYEYIIQSALMMAFSKTTRKATKFFLILLALLGYFTGYLAFTVPSYAYSQPKLNTTFYSFK